MSLILFIEGGGGAFETQIPAKSTFIGEYRVPNTSEITSLERFDTIIENLLVMV